MIVDTHTHIYPDKIAGIIAKKLVKEDGKLVDFTTRGLLSSMDRLGINSSVLFNIAEKPSVVRPANDFLASVCDGQRLVGLGTIHPDYEDFKDEIDRIKVMGLRGVKFHSRYQNFFVDEERMLRIYQKLCDDDMVAYFHIGGESALPAAEVQASPQRLARVLEILPRLKVVAAHFGGFSMPGEAEEYLIGKDVYLDTAWTSRHLLGSEVITRIIKKHGIEKILFASDYPTDVQRMINWVLAWPISTEEKERIFWKNANEFFGLNL